MTDTTQPREQAAIDLDKLREAFDKAFLSWNGFHTKDELTQEWAPGTLAGEMFRSGYRAALPRQAAPEAPTLQDWLKIIHDDELTPGDRLQRISSRIQAVLASTGATPEAPDSEQQAGEPTCAMCNDSGIVGYPPDQYEECPDCIKARAATTASADKGEKA